MGKTNETITTAEPVKKQSVEEMEAELRALELEEKRLAVAFQKANLEDMSERLQERELKRQQHRQSAITNGETLRQNSNKEQAVQERCNHRKGGQGAHGVVGGQGDSPDYAVIKHTFPNGDTWVRCQRCGKAWKPPVRSDFDSVELYTIAQERYKQALDFQTKNQPSSSIIFRFSDGGEYYREVTKASTLR